MKSYDKQLKKAYSQPLPFNIACMPALVPHNPLSVAMYLAAWLRLPFTSVDQGRYEIELCADVPGVDLPDLKVAIKLWQHGFFGKGTLSRSEPSWFGRNARRLGFDGGDFSLEELTEIRRAKRREFKLKREQQQQEELSIRQQGGVLNENDKPSLKPAAEIKSRTNETENKEEERRVEDIALIRGNTIVQLEKLHLHPCEVVFLQLSFGILQSDAFSSLAHLLTTMLPTDEAWQRYVVYHYFRSLGWCVRDGIKFGVDWLVYKRGPPFQHAEYAVHVVSVHDTPDWWWVHANMRVVNNAKKTLMLTYVDSPSASDLSSVRNPYEFKKMLNKCTVKPVNFTRFTPSRSRD